MTVNCPNCGAELDAPENTINQKVQCLVCGTKFTIGSMVCRKCGAELLPDAKFCGKCGNKLEESSADASSGFSADQPAELQAGVSPGKSPKQFGLLMNAIWAAIGLNVLSGIIGLFDVCVYYVSGRFLFFIFDAGFCALYVWLAKGIAQRKNWARLTFVAYVLLWCVLGLFGFATGGNENGLLVIIDLLTIAVQIYCVVLLFKKDIAKYFSKAKDGVKRSMIFWGVFVALFVFMFKCVASHGGDQSYLVDCANAAVRGSDEAYSSLIEYSIANSGFTGSAGEIIDAAVQEVDAFIAAQTSEGSVPEKVKEHTGKTEEMNWGEIMRILVKVFMIISGIIEACKKKR